MKIDIKEIRSARIFCESRMSLEINKLRSDFKNRHSNDTGLTKFSGLDSAITQLRNVKKLYTLYEALYLLEETIEENNAAYKTNVTFKPPLVTNAEKIN